MSTTTTTSALFVPDNRPSLFTFPRMYRAWLACRRTKRNSVSALAFEIDAEANLLTLVNELRERRYKPSTSICFYTEKPKCREIFAAAFRDRIVHHLIYNALSPVWEKRFVHHSYACRPGKGTHAAAFALQGFLRKITRNGSRRAFYLKLDILNFFMSVDRRRLFERLTQRSLAPELLWLLRIVVFHDPTADYCMMDRENMRFKLPPHKSLFHAKPGCGLPIGNLTSQFFANVYLDALDQFVKHELKCRYYLRYVDDFILLDLDPSRLRDWKEKIAAFLAERLQLSLREQASRIAPVSGGVDFAGFIVRSHYLLVRRRVVGHVTARLRKVRDKLAANRGHYIVYHFHEKTLATLLAAMNSYLGHFKHAQTHKLLEKLWGEFNFLEKFYRLSSRRLVRRDRGLRKKQTLKQQITWLRKEFPQHLRLIEIGCYYEAFGRDAKILAQTAGLVLHAKWRGYQYGCGFPARCLDKIAERLRKSRVPLVIVRQTGRERYKTKERVLYLIVEYPWDDLP